MVNDHTKRLNEGAMQARAPALVSIAIPSYNSASTLRETLDSVLAQSYPNIEVIVVDDGSTDDTESVVRRYGARVRYVHTAYGGLASARNAGLQQARGVYVALLDADDICAPQRIAAQVAFLETDAEIILCCSDFSAFDNDGEISSSYIGVYYPLIGSAAGGPAGLFAQRATLDLASVPYIGMEEAVTTFSGNIYDRLVAGNVIHPPTVCFRREAVAKAGPFDERLRNTCDYDWLVRVSRLGKIGYMATPLLKYRVSESQLSSDRNQARTMVEIVHVMEKIRAADPELYQRRRSEIRRRMGRCYLSAANACAAKQPAAALSHLLRSIGLLGIQFATFKVLLKTVIPPRLIELIRQWRVS
jgi:GT2 family glycosyltransferase